jgi:hypothetical protein
MNMSIVVLCTVTSPAPMDRKKFHKKCNWSVHQPLDNRISLSKERTDAATERLYSCSQLITDNKTRQTFRSQTYICLSFRKSKNGKFWKWKQLVFHARLIIPLSTSVSAHSTEACSFPRQRWLHEIRHSSVGTIAQSSGSSHHLAIMTMHHTALCTKLQRRTRAHYVSN